LAEENLEKLLETLSLINHRFIMGDPVCVAYLNYVKKQNDLTCEKLINCANYAANLFTLTKKQKGSISDMMDVLHRRNANFIASAVRTMSLLPNKSALNLALLHEINDVLVDLVTKAYDVMLKNKANKEEMKAIQKFGNFLLSDTWKREITKPIKVSR